MNLKNYTSQTPVNRSIERIEKVLVDNGATNIVKSYGLGKTLESVAFQVDLNGMTLPFKLPAKVQECFKAMWKEIRRPRPGTEERIRKQAERTAWKIVCDWVEVQMTMVRLQQAEFLQVFLPYTYNPVTEQTFFEKLKDSGFKQLTHSAKEKE